MDIEMLTNPDCYRCPHRRNIEGNAHSSCHHPLLKSIWDMPIAGLLMCAGGLPPIPLEITVNGTVIEVTTFDPHGIAKGWASWPFNYDPIWLQVCWLWIAECSKGTIKEVPNAEDVVR